MQFHICHSGVGLNQVKIHVRKGEVIYGRSQDVPGHADDFSYPNRCVGINISRQHGGSKLLKPHYNDLSISHNSYPPGC
jgi:hypothetical protein